MKVIGKKRTMNNIIEQIRKSANGLPVYGHQLIWRINECEIKHSELIEKLEEIGLGQYAPPMPSAKATLKKAISLWINETMGHTSIKKNTIKTINTRTSQRLAYVVIGEVRDFEALDLGHTTELRVIMDKSTEEIEILSSASEEQKNQALNEISKRWNDIRNKVIDSNSISKVLKNIATGLGALNIRRGVYFMRSSENDSKLGPLTAFVENLSEKSFFMATPIIDNEAAQLRIRRALHAGVIDELNRLRADLKPLVERMLKGGKVSEATVNNRLADYNTLKSQVNEIENALGEAADECRKYIDELAEMITNIDICDVEILDLDAAERMRRRQELEETEISVPTLEEIKDIPNPIPLNIEPLSPEEEAQAEAEEADRFVRLDFF